MAAFPTNNQDPRLIVLGDSNNSACTLTRASIKAIGKEDITDQGMKEVGMISIIAGAKEARMVGVKENSLYDLFQSRMVPNINKKGQEQGSAIAPFSLIPRRNMLNANFFRIESAQATPGAGTNGIPVHAWDVTVVTGAGDVDGSAWVKSPSNSLKNLERYFLPGAGVVAEFVASTAAYASNFTIRSAVNADAGGVSKATVTLVPDKTAAWWGTASAPQKNAYKPTAGNVTLLGNDINDFESWGHQYPAVNNLSLIEYWQQTHRTAHEYDDAYVEALENGNMSEYFKRFLTVPLAEQRRQQEELDQKALLNTYWFGGRLNELQTTTTYDQLPQVVDTANANCPLEFKSRTLGIRTQLAEGLKVSDLAQAALNLDTWMTANYNLMRYREGTSSGTVDTIDWMTDRTTKALIQQLMLKYYKSRYSADTYVQFAQFGQIIKSGDIQTQFEYDKYWLPDQGVFAAVITHRYFDDRISSFATAQKSRGRMLAAVDWGDIAINVLRTNSARRETNKLDELYRYQIKINEKHTLLKSVTFEVRVGDVNRHLIYENFSADCPVLTAPSCDLS